ncbi:hypothetical protein TNCV_1045541 [Trichonephila clavipes]|nr:hypothetical protein TNCV_1045541 [Trichonephila clavipes]
MWRNYRKFDLLTGQGARAPLKVEGSGAWHRLAHCRYTQDTEEKLPEKQSPKLGQNFYVSMNHYGIENAITPNQATQNNDVIAHLPMTSNLFSFDRAEEECPRV